MGLDLRACNKWQLIKKACTLYLNNLHDTHIEIFIGISLDIYANFETTILYTIKYFCVIISTSFPFIHIFKNLYRKRFLCPSENSILSDESHFIAFVNGLILLHYILLFVNIRRVRKVALRTIFHVLYVRIKNSNTKDTV